MVKKLVDRSQLPKYDHGQYLNHKGLIMQHKRIFILDGHPAKASLSRAFAQTYAAAAQTIGHEVRITHMHDLTIHNDGFTGYGKNTPLGPDQLAFQQDVTWAEHIVLTTPMWWGGMPAKLKALIDSTFLPGWAFDPRKQKRGMPMPLLTGRTARIIVTSDTPTILFSLLYRKAMLRQLKGQIFHFVGIKPARVTHFAPASKADTKTTSTWLGAVKALGKSAQ